MALPDLLRALRERATERRDEELSAAARLTERVRSESRSALERRRGDFVARLRREEEETARRALSRARAEATAAQLAARDRLLTRVRAALDARIEEAGTDADYLGSLPRELSEGLARLPKGRVVVRARAELLKSIASALGGDDRVDLDASPDLGAGFTASVPTEGVELDGTLVTRLEHAWPRLAVTVLRDATT